LHWVKGAGGGVVECDKPVDFFRGEGAEAGKGCYITATTKFWVLAAYGAALRLRGVGVGGGRLAAGVKEVMSFTFFVK